MLAFHLTIISVMLSIKVAGGELGQQGVVAHLSSTAALFVGFCLTLLGLWWLLLSQNLDAQGLSRAWPFTLGTITTYLALSQTVTAFMHEYLLGLKLVVEASLPGPSDTSQSLVLFDTLGNIPLSFLLVMGSALWTLITYAAPLSTILRGPVHGGHRWVFAAYYLAFQVPIYWVYASAWHLQYVPADHSTNMLRLFGLQFVQPLLWFR